MKKILMIMVVAVLLCACQKSRTDRLETILKAATEQIKEAKSVDDMQKIEVATQAQIEKVMEEYKEEEMKPEDAQKLGPILNEYYTAFYTKAAEFGRGVPAPEYPEDDTTMKSDSVSAL